MKWGFVAIFVLVSYDGKTVARTYEGMNEQTIQALVTAEGKTAQIVTEKEFKEYLNTNALPPPPIDPARAQAKLDLNNTGKTPEERLEAVIKYLDLDK